MHLTFVLPWKHTFYKLKPGEKWLSLSGSYISYTLIADRPLNCRDLNKWLSPNLRQPYPNAALILSWECYRVLNDLRKARSEKILTAFGLYFKSYPSLNNKSRTILLLFSVGSDRRCREVHGRLQKMLLFTGDTKMTLKQIIYVYNYVNLSRLFSFAKFYFSKEVKRWLIINLEIFSLIIIVALSEPVAIKSLVF